MQTPFQKIKEASHLTFAQACDNGQPRRVRAPGLSHEKDEVLVSGLPEGGHLFPESLQRGLVLHVLTLVKEFHRHIASPATLVN